MKSSITKNCEPLICPLQYFEADALVQLLWSPIADTKNHIQKIEVCRQETDNNDDDYGRILSLYEIFAKQYLAVYFQAQRDSTNFQPQ